MLQCVEELKYRNGLVLRKENYVWNEKKINLLFMFAVIFGRRGRRRKKLLAFIYSV